MASLGSGAYRGTTVCLRAWCALRLSARPLTVGGRVGPAMCCSWPSPSLGPAGSLPLPSALSTDVPAPPDPRPNLHGAPPARSPLHPFASLNFKPPAPRTGLACYPRPAAARGSRVGGVVVSEKQSLCVGLHEFGSASLSPRATRSLAQFSCEAIFFRPISRFSAPSLVSLRMCRVWCCAPCSMRPSSLRSAAWRASATGRGHGRGWCGPGRGCQLR